VYQCSKLLGAGLTNCPYMYMKYGIAALSSLFSMEVVERRGGATAGVMEREAGVKEDSTD